MKKPQQCVDPCFFSSGGDFIHTIFQQDAALVDVDAIFFCMLKISFNLVWYLLDYPVISATQLFEVSEHKKIEMTTALPRLLEINHQLLCSSLNFKYKHTYLMEMLMSYH